MHIRTHLELLDWCGFLVEWGVAIQKGQRDDKRANPRNRLNVFPRRESAPHIASLEG